jgi:hypothetical protein
VSPGDLARFETKYIAFPNGCWVWVGARKWYGSREKHNRAQFRFDGGTKAASRVSFAHFKGPIPVGLNVCHTCDDGLCVNPEHLFLGTQSDNIRDCVAKGRHKSGFSRRDGGKR